MENPTHLGDGVYAHFNGYAVDISVNDHRNESVVTLDPSVIEALVKWFTAMRKESVQ